MIILVLGWDLMLGAVSVATVIVIDELLRRRRPAFLAFNGSLMIVGAIVLVVLTTSREFNPFHSVLALVGAAGLGFVGTWMVVEMRDGPARSPRRRAS